MAEGIPRRNLTDPKEICRNRKEKLKETNNKRAWINGCMDLNKVKKVCLRKRCVFTTYYKIKLPIIFSSKSMTFISKNELLMFIKI